MTNQQWLAEQIKKLPPEEVYDLMYNIIINIGSRYNTSRGGVADWLMRDAIEVAPLKMPPAAEQRSCDRNICTENEYNGVSCDECEVAKNYNLEDDDSPCMNCEVGE